MSNNKKAQPTALVRGLDPRIKIRGEYRHFMDDVVRCYVYLVTGDEERAYELMSTIAIDAARFSAVAHGNTQVNPRTLYIRKARSKQ
jgi:hypothetical protein